MLAIVKYSLGKRESVCMPAAHTRDKQGYDFFALPVPIQSNSYGALVIRVMHLPESKYEAEFNNLKRSVNWMRLASVSKFQEDAFYSDVVSLLAACFGQGSYDQGLLRMVAQLTSQFACERDAFAEFRGHHCHVMALSNSVSFDQRSTCPACN